MEKKDIFYSQKRESSVDFVLNSFKKLLITKKLIPGDSIPSETILSQSLNVSRGTIREAMKILSAFGVVEIRRGDGTYISKSIGNELFNPFLFNLIMSDTDVKQLVELRELIEYQIVMLIIKNADDTDVLEIEEAYLEMERSIDGMAKNDGVAKNEGISLMEYDLHFHRALGHATKNVLVEKIYNFILELFTPYIENTYSHEKNEINAKMIHKEILTSLKERDVDKATKAIKKSIDEWRSLL